MEALPPKVMLSGSSFILMGFRYARCLGGGSLPEMRYRENPGNESKRVEKVRESLKER